MLNFKAQFNNESTSILLKNTKNIFSKKLDSINVNILFQTATFYNQFFYENDVEVLFVFLIINNFITKMESFGLQIFFASLINY